MENTDCAIRDIALAARNAGRIIGMASTLAKNMFLEKLAVLLAENEEHIMRANANDLRSAREAGMDDPRLDRLALTPAICAEMRKACLHVAAQDDPVGVTETQWQRPNGLLVGKMRIPLGTIAMIYEARPNVTIDAAIICIKAGNSVILRGGSEAGQTNLALVEIIRQALVFAGLPPDAAQFVSFGGHEAVMSLCRMDGLIDLVIPRGGEKLVRAVCEAATVPVLMHYKGVCHAYIDKDADIASSCRIVENAKAQRPGVCNALECLLVHRDIAGNFLPALAQKLAAHNIEFRACPASLPLLGPNAVMQKESDLGCEFHDLILAVRIVDNMEDAMAHIASYGSRHTEIICTRNYDNAMKFLREVDASMVGVNASTRFNDGGQLGLGAEIGISTSKLHSYGPMGVKELTTSKYVVLGNGQIRD